MLFNPDFKDMLLALSDAKIDFLLVGAYAVVAHGHPRALGTLISGCAQTPILLPVSIAFSPNSERPCTT